MSLSKVEEREYALQNPCSNCTNLHLPSQACDSLLIFNYMPKFNEAIQGITQDEKFYIVTILNTKTERVACLDISFVMKQNNLDSKRLFHCFKKGSTMIEQILCFEMKERNFIFVKPKEGVQLNKIITRSTKKVHNICVNLYNDHFLSKKDKEQCYKFIAEYSLENRLFYQKKGLNIIVGGKTFFRDRVLEQDCLTFETFSCLNSNELTENLQQSFENNDLIIIDADKSKEGEKELHEDLNTLAGKPESDYDDQVKEEKFIELENVKRLSISTATSEEEAEFNEPDYLYLTLEDTINKNEENKNVLKGIAKLKNLGNTCYMNSALQCLFNAQPFMNYFINHELKDNLELSCIFAAFAKEVHSPINYSEIHADFLTVIKGIIDQGKINSNFSTNKQNDAYEFLLTFLEQISLETNHLKNPKGYEQLSLDPNGDIQEQSQRHIKYMKMRQFSVVTEVFGAQIFGESYCKKKCNSKIIGFEPSWGLSLSIKNTSAENYTIPKIEDLLAEYAKQEAFAQYCKNCKEETEYIAQNILFKTPKILVIHLKRFKQSFGKFIKADAKVLVSKSLTLKKFVHKSSPDYERNLTYTLFGIIHHNGTLKNGHYIAY